MNRFVADCRREWARLGVPVAESNEMAADLEADLADAEADGVSPEAVLGNGYFDAASFAASWATARGVVGAPVRSRTTIQVRTLVLAASGLVAAVLALGGLLLLVRPGLGAKGFSISPVAHRIMKPLAPIIVTPRGPHSSFVGGPGNLHAFIVAGPGGAIGPLGLALLALGLVVLAVVLVIWRPWSARRGRPGPDPTSGTPSYP